MDIFSLKRDSDVLLLYEQSNMFSLSLSLALCRIQFPSHTVAALKFRMMTFVLPHCTVSLAFAWMESDSALSCFADSICIGLQRRGWSSTIFIQNNFLSLNWCLTTEPAAALCQRGIRSPLAPRFPHSVHFMQNLSPEVCSSNSIPFHLHVRGAWPWISCSSLRELFWYCIGHWPTMSKRLNEALL